ncbi:MAG: xylulokinase [Planctomycetia bacterium]|nr:xylulokinase [Planctomycetia bacterium]
MPYLLAHDLGTSGNKATLYSTDGKLVASRTWSYDLFISHGNWAEQSAHDWWRAVCETTKELVSTVNPGEIVVVSFSGQMMGCLCVDKDSEPLANSLIWADLRSVEEEKFLRTKISEEEFYRITGHRMSPAYGGFKFMWMKKHFPEIYARTYKTLNAKDYILLKLTGKYVTDYSDASSICLMDLNTMDWSDTILDLAGLDRAKMPELHRSTDVIGKVTREAASETGLLEGTPVVCGGGDGACAAVGSACIREGVANCCLGTSSWISISSPTPIYDPKMTTFNFAHIVPGYVMPTGTMQCGGGSLDWAVKTLCKDADDVTIYAAIQEEVLASPPGAKGLIFLPYLIGERSPRWDTNAKGAFIGLTLEHTRGDMIRAVMEGVAMNLDLVLKVFTARTAINQLTAIGGGARNDVWLQIFADVFGVPMMKPNHLESATSMGAAITGGVGVGAFENFDAIDRFLQPEKVFHPSDNREVYDGRKALFDECYYQLKETFTRLSNCD